MRGVPLRWRLILGLLRRLPQVALSRLVGWMVDRRIPRLLRPLLIGGFARVAGIDQGEAEAPPAAYPSIGAYFTRRLEPDARSWSGPEGLPGSPVDGVVGAMGPIEDGTAVQAKGLRYSVAELLAGVDRAGADGRFIADGGSIAGGRSSGDGWSSADGRSSAGGGSSAGGRSSGEGWSNARARSTSYGRPPMTSEWWRGGRFLTLYLSPRHYHRIHWPVGGHVPAAVRVPGRLLPVNEPSVRTQPGLFVTNARTVVRLDAPGGRLAVVAVGAFNVGRISAAFEPDWAVGADRQRARGDRRTRSVPDWRTRSAPDWREYDPPVRVERGSELGAFHLGSTVVLVFGPEWGRTFSPTLLAGSEIRLGDPLLEAAPEGSGSNGAQEDS